MQDFLLHCVALQAEVLPALAKEIEAEDSRRGRSWFLATTLLQGDQPDIGGGYAVLTYNPFSQHLAYHLEHRTIANGSANFVIPQLLNLSYSDRVTEGIVLRSDVETEPVDVTSPKATCQEATGLVCGPPQGMMKILPSLLCLLHLRACLRVCVCGSTMPPRPEVACALSPLISQPTYVCYAKHASLRL